MIGNLLCRAKHQCCNHFVNQIPTTNDLRWDLWKTDNLSVRATWWEFRVRFMFSPSHYSAVCHIMIYWTVLYLYVCYSINICSFWEFLYYCAKMLIYMFLTCLVLSLAWQLLFIPSLRWSSVMPSRDTVLSRVSYKIIILISLCGQCMHAFCRNIYYPLKAHYLNWSHHQYHLPRHQHHCWHCRHH